MEAEVPPTRTEVRRDRLVGGLIAVVSVAIVAPFLVARFKANADEARYIEKATHVLGRVVELREAADRNQDLDETGEPPSMEVTVELTTLDGRLIRVSKIGPMNGRDAVRLLTAHEVDVWYDSNDPAHAIIRWERP